MLWLHRLRLGHLAYRFLADVGRGEVRGVLSHPSRDETARRMGHPRRLAGMEFQNGGWATRQKVQLGGSIHMKSTFTLGDLSKSTVGTEAEAAAAVEVGGHSVGVNAGSVGLETDSDGTTPTGSGPALELGGVKQGTGSDAETTFGGAEYDGIGGGVSVSVSTDALSSTIDDLMNLATFGPEQ